MLMEDRLKALQEASRICWKCKAELREEEVMTVTDGHSISIDFCYRCYEQHRGKRHR
ncbi:hypothetical protein QRD89_16810 [Halobacillus sp. ACCC02827]|uniref:hypothetical protein n=1 Tax=Bacillaceae TaxID=186817 RepID=UPI000AF420AA|nr:MULTISPECIES: hypothetical protein [Bacillaceae]QHT48130.1 hypothetical protein M662_17130 [Bacillus sp. SB49]WJE15364.1 hypothetical protein QRD89_16810 [Halobacillus sp. ACCC02827]